MHLPSVLLRFSSVDSRGFRALREVGLALAIGVASVAAIVVIVVIVVVVIAIVIVVVAAAAVFVAMMAVIVSEHIAILLLTNIYRR